MRAPARRRRAITAAAAGALCAAAGCADFSSPSDPTGGLPDVVVAHPSFATHLQPIFTARCAQGGCHTPVSHQASLDLSAGHAYANLVNVRALRDTLPRVLPGDAQNSFLWRVLQADSLLHPTLPRMPLAAQPLTANQIQTIANWITDVAPNN